MGYYHPGPICIGKETGAHRSEGMDLPRITSPQVFKPLVFIPSMSSVRGTMGEVAEDSWMPGAGGETEAACDR